MNNDFLYGFLSFLASGLLFIENRRFVSRKKKNNGLDSYDTGMIIPRNWVLIVFFAVLGIYYLLEFIFNV